MTASGLPPDVRGTVATVGTFDGVHRGHRDVVARLVERARTSSLRSVVVTFDPHPLEVLDPERAPLRLTTGVEKLAGRGQDLLLPGPSPGRRGGSGSPRLWGGALGRHCVRLVQLRVTHSVRCV